MSSEEVFKEVNVYWADNFEQVRVGFNCVAGDVIGKFRGRGMRQKQM
jgi:hypothetical protein